ncbi:MAG: tyrosine--tRNA ligase, partial [Sphingobacteriaceae bacterium]|nr:tyrosine--tRNA ligase [Cytophagaceae bacterium]
ETEHAAAPHLRLMQRALAQDVTTRVHSAADYETAVQASEVLYGKGTLETLQGLDATTFASLFEGVPQTSLTKADLAACATVTDFLAQAGVYPSKGEARRAIQGGGVSVNKTKLTDPAQATEFSLLLEKFVLVGKGKKNHLVRVEG